MMRAEAIAFAAAGAVSIVAPSVGVVLLAAVALAPAIPPFPDTRRHIGAAFATAVVLGSGWLGVGIYQLIRHYPSPALEHVALFGALVGLTVGAMRLGRPGDAEPERERAMAGFARAGFASILALFVAIVAWREASPGGGLASLKPLTAALQPMVGAVVLGFVLERRLLLATWRRTPWRPLAFVAGGALVLAGAIWTARFR